MRNVTSPAQRRGSRTAIGLFTGAALAIGISLAGTSGAYAFNQRLETLFTHFVDCKILLLTNPAKHAKLCGPSRVVTLLESIASKGSPSGPEAGTPVQSVPDCVPSWENCWCHEYEYEYSDS